MSETARMPHPSRTSAQRRTLDAIGCGQPPRCSHRTCKALLNVGLIVEAGSQARRVTPGLDHVPVYEMSIPVHMQLCSAVAFTDEKMAAFEAELEAAP
jgi:hypothetical protein